MNTGKWGGAAPRPDPDPGDVATATIERPKMEADVAWRLDQLVLAGYAMEAALTIATCRDIDLHYAVALVERGCPSELALAILL